MGKRKRNIKKRQDYRQGGRVALARGRRPKEETWALDPNDLSKKIISPTPTQNDIKKDPAPAPEKERPQATSISQPQPKAEQPSVQTDREDTMTDAQKEAAERALRASQGRGRGAGSGGRGTGGGGGGNNTTETTSTTTGARPGTEKPTYSNLTEAQQEEARQRVKDAAEGKVPESAIIPDAVKADESIASDTVTMEDVGDAKAETIEMPSEERVTTGVSTTAKKQEVGDAAKMEASKITEAPVIDAQTGQVSSEAIAEMQNATLTMAATGVTVDEGKASDALAETIVGTLSPEAKAEAAKVAGTDLPRVLRAKKQLRRAGLTEDQINLIGNDPDLLEDELMNYTEAERGMIAGLPEEALVTTQLNALLEGVENGEIPAFARPAMAAVEQMLAQRGMSASTVGRDALINAMIQSAIPLAQSNAQSIKESVMQQTTIEAQAEQMNAQMRQQTALANADKVFNMDMANFTAEQQTALSNSKFLQTVVLTDTSNEQNAILTNAANMAKLDLAELDSNTRLAAQNAQTFLQMDMANLNNRQQAEILSAQQEQQTLLSNQASENAARNANMVSENQREQFVASLAQQVEMNNAARNDAMSTFNASQANASEARRVGIEADINKANAAMVTDINKMNTQMDFNRSQWNAANAQAVMQSNTQWRRQANLANTAAQNEVNARNAQNAYGLSSQAMSFMWQELRDQAEFDFKWADNEATRKTQLLATAIANEGEAASKWATNLNSVTSVIDRFFGG